MHSSPRGHKATNLSSTVLILKYLCSVLRGHSKTSQSLLSMKLSTGICYYGRNILPFICLNPVVVKVWRDHIWEKKVPGEQHRDSFWLAVQLLRKGERVSFKLEQGGHPWPWLSLRSPVQGILLNSWKRNLDHLLPVGKAGAQLD